MISLLAVLMLSAAPVDLEAETRAYHQQRLTALEAEGWLNLVGLLWLAPGDNRAGSAKDNALVFPKGAPAKLGTFFWGKDAVTFEPVPGVTVTERGKPFPGGALAVEPDSKTPTTLEVGTLSFFPIRRGEKLGIRIKDSQAPARQAFTDIPMFPANPTWRVMGKLEAQDPPGKLAVPNVLGSIDEVESPGTVVFSVGGKTYRLTPTATAKDPDYFFVFSDLTNRDTTYGAGRFLHTGKADAKGNMLLDFNHAYNPPCAFSAFATCPLPPKQNRIPARIEAGEKRAGHP